MRELTIDAPDARRTEMAGAAFAACVRTSVRAPLTLWLTGELGSGKTTFSRGFIRALGYDGDVVSPTYTLLESYEAGGLNVLHFDLYRLGSAREFEEIGAQESLDECDICLIEWAEKVSSGLPAPDVALRFEYAGEARRIEAGAKSETGETLLFCVSRRE